MSSLLLGRTATLPIEFGGLQGQKKNTGIQREAIESDPDFICLCVLTDWQGNLDQQSESCLSLHLMVTSDPVTERRWRILHDLTSLEYWTSGYDPFGKKL